MKPFDLQEYIKNPSRRVVTRDGRPVRIICTDAKRKYEIIGLIEKDGKEIIDCYTPDGKHFMDITSDYDLFFETEKKNGWLNLYRNDYGCLTTGYVRGTKEEALKEIGSKSNSCKYVDTIEIEWEE